MRDVLRAELKAEAATLRLESTTLRLELTTPLQRIENKLDHYAEVQVRN
jgi:hypothetical protein